MPPGAVRPIWRQLKGWNSVRSKVTWPNAIALFYIASAMLNLGGSKWDNRTLLLVNPGSPSFLSSPSRKIFKGRL